MGRLIDADKFKEYIEIGVELAFFQAPLKAKKVEKMADSIIADIDAQPTVEAIPIPQDATNEDILKAVFPNDADDIIKYIKAAILNGWLNSKYER